jgi:hypothetical protein
LILARSAGVTCDGSTPKTRDAVTVWKSIPDLKASIRLSSALA